MKNSNLVPKKILIIDDNEGILFALQKALELKGYEVHTFETFMGVNAVAKVAPDLLYLDVSLTGKDGREVARELKRNDKTKHIPIVILTAYLNASDLANEAGADDFLPKPFELAHLWKITEKYTSTSEKELTVEHKKRKKSATVLS